MTWASVLKLCFLNLGEDDFEIYGSLRGSKWPIYVSARGSLSCSRHSNHGLPLADRRWLVRDGLSSVFPNH